MRANSAGLNRAARYNRCASIPVERLNRIKLTPSDSARSYMLRGGALEMSIYIYLTEVVKLRSFIASKCDRNPPTIYRLAALDPRVSGFTFARSAKRFEESQQTLEVNLVCRSRPFRIRVAVHVAALSRCRFFCGPQWND